MRELRDHTTDEENPLPPPALSARSQDSWRGKGVNENPDSPAHAPVAPSNGLPSLPYRIRT